MYDISYENLIMYSKTLPSFNTDKKDRKKNNQIISTKAEINKFMLEHIGKK